MKNDVAKPLFDLDDPQFRTTPLQQMAASCTGALITSLFVTPLDVVKIRLQAQQRLLANSKCFLYCNGLMDHLCPCGNGTPDWFRRPGHFSGTIDAFVKISKAEGVMSLWSGLGPTLVLALPTTILYFVSYEQLRLRFKDWHNKKTKTGELQVQPFWIPVTAGASARILAATCVSPLELIRTKMQSQKLSYNEMFQALRVLIRNNGFLSLWKGLGPTLLRDVPFSAIYWVNYETIKSVYNQSVPSFTFSFFAGAVAGSIAAIITIPFDVVKTHQQIDFGEKLYSDNPKKTQSILESILHIYKRSGVQGLFAGLVPRVVKVAPACAIMIATFEHSKQVFYKLSLRRKETESSNINIQMNSDAL